MINSQELVNLQTPHRVNLTKEDPLVRKILEDRLAVTDLKPKPPSLLQETDIMIEMEPRSTIKSPKEATNFMAARNQGSLKQQLLDQKVEARPPSEKRTIDAT